MVATLDEVENLPTLLARIRSVLPVSPVFVVDDDSRDGTAEWLDQYRQNDPNFGFLIRKSARGLGSATIEGFQVAIRRAATWVATIDADGSHDPSVLKQMLDQTHTGQLEGLDVCIGSRYTPGGAIEGWPLARRVASRLVNLISRWVIGLRPHDNTSALRLYRVSTLRNIDVSTIHNRGYGYLQEILFRLQRQKSSFREFPMTFRNREKGKSKVTIGEALSVLSGLLRLFALRLFSRPSG